MQLEIEETIKHVGRYISDNAHFHGLEKAIDLARAINDGFGFTFYYVKGGKRVKISEATLNDDLFEKSVELGKRWFIKQ
jgi:hypothetical protein